MVGRKRQCSAVQCCALLVTLGQNVPGQTTTNLKKIAIPDKMKNLHLALEVDKSNKMYNYFWKILFCESFRSGTPALNPLFLYSQED